MTIHRRKKTGLSNQLTCFNSINSFLQKDNGALNEAPLFLSPAYFQALEESAPAGMSFRYVSLYEKNTLTGFYYFQVIDLSAKELGRIIHLEPYSKLLNHFSGVINTILFGVKKDRSNYLLICGNMMISGDFGIYSAKQNKEDVYGKLPDVVELVRNDLEQEGKVIASIVKDFVASDDPVKKHLPVKWYSRMLMDPIMRMKIEDDWKVFTDYTDALSAKYRLRCNNARKKISAFTIRDLSTAEMRKAKSEIDVLYKAVQLKSPVRLVKSDAECLISLSKNLGNAFSFRAFYDKNKMIAFMCGMKDGDHYEAHHIGIDYHYNKSHNIYLNILYEFISLAIEAEVKELSFGRTALEMKTTVGAVPLEYNSYLRLNNYMLNCLVKPFLPSTSSTEWTARNPFKQ